MKPYLHPPGENEDLFAVARRNDPLTSHLAAASVKRITEFHKDILDMLKLYGPMTDEQIYRQFQLAEIKISESGARTRRKELVDMAEVMFTGDTLFTKSGRKTQVWGLRK